MRRKEFFVAMALVLILALALSSTISCTRSRSTPNGKYEILRKAVLGNTWQMYQIRITLESGSDFDVDLLDLVGTDKVDGYFYPEKGTGASLEIKAGTNPIYNADPATVSLGGALSDRFSFPANQPPGTAYVLKFHNGGTATVTVFTELIYPKTGSIRGTIDIK